MTAQISALQRTLANLGTIREDREKQQTLEEITAQAQVLVDSQQDALTIYQQIAADIERQAMKQWKILRDTQSKIFEIAQDVAVNKGQTQDKMFEKWDEYIRG
jgi:hypothetical protein